MSPVVLSLAGLFVLAYGAVAIFALRHRVLGRLALREAVRRKGQSLLVVAGLMGGSGLGRRFLARHRVPQLGARRPHCDQR